VWEPIFAVVFSVGIPIEDDGNEGNFFSFNKIYLNIIQGHTKCLYISLLLLCDGSDGLNDDEIKIVENFMKAK